MKPPIKFNNLYTIQPDDIKKKAKNTFFGVELPQEEIEEIEKQENYEEEPEEEEEDEDQAKFFITEDERKKGKKPKGEKRYSEAEYKITEDNYEVNEDQDGDQHEEESENIERDEKESEQIEEVQEEDGSLNDYEINLNDIKNLDDFKKIASKIIGGESKDYEQAVEVSAAYKMLRQAMKKTNVNEKTIESQLNQSSKKGSHKSRKYYLFWVDFLTF